MYRNAKGFYRIHLYFTFSLLYIRALFQTSGLQSGDCCMLANSSPVQTALTFLLESLHNVPPFLAMSSCFCLKTRAPRLPGHWTHRNGTHKGTSRKLSHGGRVWNGTRSGPQAGVNYQYASSCSRPFIFSSCCLHLLS